MADKAPRKHDLSEDLSVAEHPDAGVRGDGAISTETGGGFSKKKLSRSSRDAAAIKRRCVSTACVACRRRKSKCDGNTPACAACSSVYGTGELY